MAWKRSGVRAPYSPPLLLALRHGSTGLYGSTPFVGAPPISDLGAHYLFRLTSEKPQNGMPRVIVGEFCFWPASYVRRVEMVPMSQLNRLAAHMRIHKVLKDECDCLVPLPESTMYLGVRLFTSKQLPMSMRHRLHKVLDRVSLRS